MSKAVSSKADAETMAKPSPCDKGDNGRCARERYCNALRLLCKPMYRYYNRGPKESYPSERDRIPTRDLWERAEKDQEEQ